MDAPTFVANHLPGARRSGSGWVDRCPTHDDRQASLSIGPGREGGTLLYCHAGCATEAVVEALGATMADLAPLRDDGATAAQHRRVTSTTRYEIKDADGSLVAVHIRYDRSDGTKSFSWGRPDGRKGLGGRKRDSLPLYGSHELPAWPADTPIVVVEGEKARDALSSAGILSLATVTGADGCPDDEVLSCLAGRSAILWPDHDDPGRRHMLRLAARLRSIAAVGWVEPPADTSKGWDAADAVAAGADLGAILASAAAVPDDDEHDARSDRDDPEPEPSSAVAQRQRREKEREEAHDRQRADWRTQGMRELPSPDLPMAVARRLVADLFTVDEARFVQHWRGGWWRWFGTHWAEVGEASIMAQLYGYTEHAWYEKPGPFAIFTIPTLWAPNRRKIADLREAFAAVVHQPQEVPMPSWLDDADDRPPAGELVSLRNGLLHVPTRALLPHDPAFFNGISVPFDHDPEAPEPREWLAFLSELWPDDPESIATLRQWFGYIISGSLLHHKILLLIGPRRGGKGTILRVLSALIGRQNVASPTLSSLATNFGLEPLIGKPLATITDARLGRDNVNQTVERLLSISGQDAVGIDRKYKPAWVGTLPTRFMIVSNELPRFGDASGAIASRFVTLVLTRNWLGREDLGLTNRLQTELPGILAWSLDGLADLDALGAFREPNSSRDAITALADLVSPTSAFVRDRCSVGLEEKVPVTVLYAAWRSWAEDNGHAVGSVQNFGIKLRAALPTVRVKRGRVGEARLRVFVGLRPLRPDEQPDDADDDDAGQPHDDAGRGPRGPESPHDAGQGPQGPRTPPSWG